VVLADDQGYGDFSCHGNPVLKTPNLDKLHGQSVRLTDYHVAPMCSPTRGQLMTGLDALHNGASSVSAGRSFIRRGIPTMAEIFAAAGYRTGHFGKWHLGDSYPNLPQQRGFQETVYHLGWGITSMADLWQNDCFDGRFRHNGTLQQYKGYCTDVWFDLAMAYMKERHAKQEPFFVYLPTNAPHGPHWVAEKYKKPYEGKGPAGFFGMIANLDENMGRLETFLTETKLRDNTIVIYFNDNGGTAGVKLYNAGMRGMKTQYYEGGHRAACFIRWPGGKLRAPCDLDAVTEVQDLLPTLIDLCGLPKPKEAKFDGTSLAGYLRGTTDRLPERMLVVQYGPPPGGQRPIRGEAAVMWNQWRLVKDKELYDIKADPAQAKDVAGQHPEIVKKLQDQLRAVVGGGRAATGTLQPHQHRRGRRKPGDAVLGRLGQRVLRQHERPARRPRAQRPVAPAGRAGRQVRDRPAPLAEGGGRRHPRGGAGLQGDRWRPSRGGGPADCQGALEDRGPRRDEGGRPPGQGSGLQRRTEEGRETADAVVVFQRGRQGIMRGVLRLRAAAVGDG
jgi:arylsulfatase